MALNDEDVVLSSAASMEEKILKRLHAIPHFETYEISEEELTAIEGGFSTRQNDLTFFSIAVSVFLSFLTVWLTLPTLPAQQSSAASPPAVVVLTPLTRAEQMYFLIMVAFGALSVYLGVRWTIAVRKDRNIFAVIRRRAIGPVGEENAEIEAADLDSLTPQTRSKS